jgi:hypothetical protein
MKRITALTSIIALTIGLFGILSCDTENPTYDVTVQWNISGLQICQTALPSGETLVFDKVVVETTNNETQEIDKSPEIDCTAYQYTIPDLDEGKYTVKLYAYANYGGEYLAFFQGQGAIAAPTEAGQTYDIQLLIGKATIQVVWGFEFGTCGGNSVTEVSVVLDSQAEGQADIQAGTTSCDAANGLPVENIPWGTYTIIVKGYAGQTQTHEGQSDPVELKPSVYETPFQIKLLPITN